jgi:hypothetical protein
MNFAIPDIEPVLRTIEHVVMGGIGILALCCLACIWNDA